MLYATSKKLNDLNLEFYRQIAPNFDSSRRYAWTGWDKLHDVFKAQNFLPKSCLDLACGNGRFYEFIQQKFTDINYVGIDSSKELLDMAQSRFKTEFILADLFNDNWPKLVGQQFDLISMFGFMHHIPGKENRVRILKDAAKLLSADGLLVISAWEFIKNEKLNKRALAWNKLGINEAELEANDYLLDWQRGQTALRYCHYLDEQEATELFKLSGLKLVTEFLADGKTIDLNHYYVLANS